MIRIHAALISFAVLIFGAINPAQAVPPIQQLKLDNGLRVLLMEAHNVPMVTMQLVMPAGSRFDAAGKGGAANMLADMLTDHTAIHDDKAWASLLDDGPIHLGAGASRDEMHMSLTVLKESLQPGLDALAEALLQPGWNKERFDILKQDSIAAAQKAQENPGTRASQAAAELLFGDHPYGHRPGGSLQSFPNITLADLKSLYQAQYKPQGAVLAVSGDITLDELVPLLQARLKNWQGKPVKGMKDIASASPIAGEHVDVKLPTTQTLVQLLRLGPARGDANFFPVFVLNHMLGGGGFASRLMEEVREKRGLVYGIYSYFVPLAVPGAFAITLQTRADQADQAETVVRELLADMAAGKITEKQIRASKSNLIGSFAQRMDSNRERVGLLAMIGIYDLPLDYLSVWAERVEAVTLKQLRQQSAFYLDPKTWNRVRVGADL
jgi:zinc protease